MAVGRSYKCPGAPLSCVRNFSLPGVNAMFRKIFNFRAILALAADVHDEGGVIALPLSIALAVAVTTRCDGCITTHVDAALKQGASREEIAEALGVAVALNAGAALYAAGHADSIAQGIEQARAAIASGAALKKLNEFIAFTNK